MSKGFRRPSYKFAIRDSEEVKREYSRKDISMLIQFIGHTRQPMTFEIFDQVLGEESLIKRLDNAFANQYSGS